MTRPCEVTIKRMGPAYPWYGRWSWDVNPLDAWWNNPDLLPSQRPAIVRLGLFGFVPWRWLAERHARKTLAEIGGHAA